jgi:hypothetical protein
MESITTRTKEKTASAAVMAFLKLLFGMLVGRQTPHQHPKHKL